MKARLPLFAKILFWFCLDLFLILVLMLWLFQLQVSAGRDSPLAGMIGSQMQSAAEAIAEELERSNRDQWDAVLMRHSAERDVTFVLFSNHGDPLAGSPIALPEEIATLVSRKAAFTSPLFPPPPASDKARQDAPPPPRATSSTSTAPLPMNFTVRTSDPTLYWAGIRLPIYVPAERKMQRTVLLAVSDSFSGNGVFFDVWPWIILVSVIVVISFILLLPMVRHITVPLSHMSRATSRIAQGRFDIKLDANRHDEIGALASSINDMSVRLDHLVNGQRRFLGSVAHELSSPIARIQLALGILENAVSDADQARLASLNEEVQELASLVNELLSYSRAENAGGKVMLGPVRIAAPVARAIRREAADYRDIHVSIPSELHAMADAELLTRALANILRNAVRYAGQEGPIHVMAQTSDQGVIITVQDSGHGVPEDMLGQIFDPFYRVDDSRTRSTGGVGLGLAIVKTCVLACKGTVVATNLEPRGFAVTITLPPVPANVEKEP